MHAGDACMTSLEFQNRGIHGPKKRTDVLNYFIMGVNIGKKFLGLAHTIVFSG